MKLLLYIAYNGADFCGWQAQKNGVTVQKTLTDAVSDLFGHTCDVTGCSRTDSGVHANMFCATVSDRGADVLTTTVPVEKIPRALSIRLPDSISVWHAVWVPTDFHARYSVSSKEYLYRIYNAPIRSPFEVGRSWHVPARISDEGFAAMQAAAAHFVGKRDFSSCMASGSDIADRTRTVFSASVTRTGDVIEFRVRADGFLYNMVRIMAGTLADVASGQIPPDSIPDRLDSLDRSAMGRTAPAEGLYLDRVFYDDPDIAGYRGDCRGGDRLG
jgi:tRNA pseudouridine38-40 synthase